MIHGNIPAEFEGNPLKKPTFPLALVDWKDKTADEDPL